MITIDNVLFLDTETTGVIDRKARWDEDYMDFPHIVQLAWIYKGREENHIIFPEGWEIPQETTEIHGITTEFAIEYGEPFGAVINRFIEDCLDAAMICGHNIHFDTQIVKANILRELGLEYYDSADVDDALYKGKRIDTMRSTMKWVDARRANGGIKFPNLEELYARCFPGETFPAHNALEDCKAVARCLPVILELGLVELKIKEYPVEQEPEKRERPENVPNSSDNSPDNKLPIPQEKSPQNENSGKISGIASELLNANDF